MELNRVHSICMNKMLADANNAMVGVIEELKNSKQSSRTIDLLKAANQLCRPKYERYKENRKRSDERLSIQRGERGIDMVSDITNSLSKSRTFVTLEQRCDCTECITKESQCCHEIKL
jgi:hypothetical protein